MEKGAEDLKTITELMTHFNAVTERMRVTHEKLQQRIVELQKELEEKNRLLRMKNRLEILGEMAACLAHEIRNPLGGISLFTDLLKKQCASDPGRMELAEKIASGVQVLNKVVEDMLTFTTTVEPHRVPGTLERVIDEALLFAEDSLQKNSVTVRRDYPGTPVTVSFDHEMMRRVFLNIVLNGVQAMEKTGGALTVTVRKDGGWLAASCSDEGPGLTAETLEKIFTPFYTSKARGTGLGLTMARKLVEVHGGEIVATNHPKRGAVFTVRLPLETGASHAQDPDR